MRAGAVVCESRGCLEEVIVVRRVPLGHLPQGKTSTAASAQVPPLLHKLFRWRVFLQLSPLDLLRVSGLGFRSRV